MINVRGKSFIGLMLGNTRVAHEEKTVIHGMKGFHSWSIIRQFQGNALSTLFFCKPRADELY